MDADAPDNLYGDGLLRGQELVGHAVGRAEPLGLAGYALIPASYFTRTHLLWEALVCLAERSPGVRSPLDWLRVGWDGDGEAGQLWPSHPSVRTTLVGPEGT
jgi:hypothetical protein